MKVLEGKAALVTGSARGIGRAAATLLARHGARVGHVGDPGRELRVQIGDGGERARREERVAEEADEALDTALLIAARDRTRLGGVVGVTGELEPVGMKADVIPHALEHDAFQIVGEDDAGHAAEGGEGLDMAAQETLEGLVEREARVRRPRPGQHQHEAREPAGRAPDGDLAEVAPIDLRLLPGQGVQAQVGLGPRGGAHRADVALDLLGGTRIPMVHSRVARSRGYCSSVLRMNALYGSSALGRTCWPGRMKRSRSMARRTVS